MSVVEIFQLAFQSSDLDISSSLAQKLIIFISEKKKRFKKKAGSEKQQVGNRVNLSRTAANVTAQHQIRVNNKNSLSHSNFDHSGSVYIAGMIAHFKFKAL